MMLPTLNNSLSGRLRHCLRRLRRLRHRTGGALALGLALLLLTPTVVDAGPRGHAKLSKTLAAQLEARSDAPVQIIVDGDRAHVERLAKRYSIKVKRHLRHGGVLEVTGGQLDALARDPDVTHLSADSVVRPTMAITHLAIGADQAWDGALGLDGVTGAGIGIAIIDSGIADHDDLQQRVVVSVGFRQRQRVCAASSPRENGAEPEASTIAEATSRQALLRAVARPTTSTDTGPTLPASPPGGRVEMQSTPTRAWRRTPT